MRRKHDIKKISFRNGRMKIVVDQKEHLIVLKKASKKLSSASKQELETYKISPSGYGIHWPLIDEDLSIEGLLKG